MNTRLVTVVFSVVVLAVCACAIDDSGADPTATPSPSLIAGETPTEADPTGSDGKLRITGFQTGLRFPDGAEVATPARKVAVLISAEYAETGGTQSDSDAWYDTVLTYCMLHRNGFKDSDIYVVYGFGRDGFYTYDYDQQTTESIQLDPSTGPPQTYYEPPYCTASDTAGGSTAESVPNSITDFPMAYPNGAGEIDGRCRPQDLFDCLASGCEQTSLWSRKIGDTGASIEALDGNDFLFVWWRGHGNVLDNGSGTEVLHLTLPATDKIAATEIVNSVAAINAGQRLLVFETCHSGCVTEYLDTEDPPGVVMASSGCDEKSNREFEPDVFHAVWTYWITGTLAGELPNSDNRTIPIGNGGWTEELCLGWPVLQAFKAARFNTIETRRTDCLEHPDEECSIQHPEIEDNAGIAKTTHLNTVGASKQ